ncbi:MAG: CRISPR-associated endoribonuclease Cas6 [Sarcina sp.]
MRVYELKLKLYLLKDIRYEDVLERTASFLDKGFCKNEIFLQKHNSREYKEYNFNYLYPTEVDKVYKVDKLYTLTIRTINKDLANYIHNYIVHHYDDNLKAIKCDIRIIPKKHIEKIYSITPIIIKNNGYWRNLESIEFFEKRLKENILKKSNYINKTSIVNHDFYNEIQFKNRKPISTNFKNINLLGDKIELSIESDQISQDLAYLSLGVSLGENSSRGFGFVNFKWL